MAFNYLTIIAEHVHFINEGMLEDVFSRLNLKDMCDLATSSKAFEEICAKIWKRDPIYRNNINNDHELSPEANIFFICKNAANFHSLQISASDIKIFNEATQNFELYNLNTLHMVINSKLSEVIPAEFLIRCTRLEYIRICQPLVPFHMDSIQQLQYLKCLEVCHLECDDDSGDIVKEIIARKGSSIWRLQTQIENFPPRWLTESAIDECRYLDGIVLKSNIKKKVNKQYLEVNMPTLRSLRNLWIVGKNVCTTSVMTFVAKCPNLENFYTDNVGNYIIYINDIMRKRQLEGIRTPYNLIPCKDVLENITKVDFV